MPQTNECDFCGGDIEPGTGTMFVRTDGTTVRFCSSKCEKNVDLGRRARDLEWTGTGDDRRPAAEVADETVGAEAESEPADAASAAAADVEGSDTEAAGEEDIEEADPEEEAEV
jgi:large subunit ribosomal protein L24e